MADRRRDVDPHHQAGANRPGRPSTANHRLRILGLAVGHFELAPMYDIAPVFHIDSRFSDFGMRVDGQRSLRYLSAGHLAREAASWGMDDRHASDVVVEVALAVRDALGAVPISPLIEPVAVEIARRANTFCRAG